MTLEPASAFGLVKGLFGAVTSVFGVFAPKLVLTFEAGKTPYFEADEYMAFAAAVADAEGNVQSVSSSSPRRWFRVGIKNRSLQTVEGVRIELATIDPPVIGHLPLPLSIMHGTGQPLTVHRSSDPTYFADVIIKVDNDNRMHIMSTTQTPRGLGGIPAARYRLGIRVNGPQHACRDQALCGRRGRCAQAGFRPGVDA